MGKKIVLVEFYGFEEIFQFFFEVDKRIPARSVHKALLRCFEEIFGEDCKKPDISYCLASFDPADLKEWRRLNRCLMKNTKGNVRLIVPDEVVEIILSEPEG
jgi:hypothetical protein